MQTYLNKLTAGVSANTLSYVNNWTDFYSKLYVVNLALERLTNSKTLTPAVKQQLMGEAKFLRAFFYFYLTNLYGDVPLTTSSDYTVNAVLARSSQTLIYQQIVADLISAQSLLSNGYVAADGQTNTTERVRPNKWAATALLARAYLSTGDWADAIKQATAIINNSAEYSLVPLNNVFLKNSNEAIWQWQPVTAGQNTWDALVFVLPASGPSTGSSIGNHPVYVSAQLENSFEAGDQRKTNWLDSVTVGGTTYYYPYKYKSATLNAPVTEYTMVLRLGEQYLIRAEAEAENNDSGDAVTDLNMIRTRAGLPNYAGPTDKASLLAAILHERQVELFTEWGSRWLDLKRTGNINAVMTAVAPTKGTTWNPDWALYPLPLYDIVQDPKLTQNPGY
ncbi:MAG: RagB/SusD family nutrient uptake outer membrane protein [Bacteroidetes bacterium]|nr:RagB/SusD family nutrient uptake outer membrane protein [Bacteroidota bacterium]